MRFAAAPEYQVFPTRERPLKPYAAAVKASGPTRELIRSFDPEVVVADIITVAGSLAAQAEGRRGRRSCRTCCPPASRASRCTRWGRSPADRRRAAHVGARAPAGDDG